MSVMRTEQPLYSSVSPTAPDVERSHPKSPGPRIAPIEARVTFMSNSIGCEACRLLAMAGITKRSERLHVLTTSEYLVVTNVDDIHAPGGSISGQRIADVASGSVYRLLATPAPFVDPRRHVGAIGIAVMTMGRRGRRLVAVGSVDGAPCDHDRVFDASEER
jgi:hypothetical protein